jgi:hypothetical protein
MKLALGNYAKYFIKLFISTAILWWCFIYIDVRELPGFIKQISISLLLLAYILDATGNLVFPALITKFSISTHRLTIPFFALLKINFIVRFYTLFLPTGFTVAIRWLKYKSFGSSADAAALVIFEKLIQVLLLTLTVIIFVLIDFRILGANIYSVLIVIFTLFLITIFCLAPFLSNKAGSYTEYIFMRFNFLLPVIIKNVIKKLLDSATQFQSINQMVALYIALLSIAGHIFLIFGLYTLSHAMGIGLSLIAIAWIRALTLIVMLVPITVANIGLREGSFIALMQFYEVPAYQAMGFGLTLTAFQIVSGVVGGLLEAWDNFIQPQKS